MLLDRFSRADQHKNNNIVFIISVIVIVFVVLVIIVVVVIVFVVVDFVVVRSVNYTLARCTHIFSAQALSDTSIGLVVVPFNLWTPRSRRKECPGRGHMTTRAIQAEDARRPIPQIALWMDSRGQKTTKKYCSYHRGQAEVAPTGFGSMKPVVTGRRMMTMSRMPTMSLLMVIRVISACSRKIGVGNGKRIDDDYMNDDLWNSVCQLILLQEVEP